MLALTAIGGVWYWIACAQASAQQQQQRSQVTAQTAPDAPSQVQAVAAADSQGVTSAQILKTTSTTSGTIAEVRVRADEGWQDTGVAVQPGQGVTVAHKSGTWSPWSGISLDGNGCLGRQDSGCDGPRQSSDYSANICCMAHAGLIGRIGDSDPFAIGNSGTRLAQQSGSLQLRINDNALSDNSGALIVRIYTGDAHDQPPLQAGVGPTHPSKAQTGQTRRSHQQPALFYYVDALDHNFTGVYLRSGPSLHARIIKALDNGARLRVILRSIRDSDGRGLRWAKVVYHRQVGYAWVDLLNPRKPRPLSTLYVDQTGEGYVGVYLRAQPALASPIESVIPNKVGLQVLTTLAMVADGERWYHAIYQHRAGYVRAKLLRQQRPPAAITLYVDGIAQGYTGVNMRSRPSMLAPVETLISNGASVRVTDVVDGDDNKNWSKVTYNGASGYAHSSFLQHRAPPWTITLRVNGSTQGYTGANLRTRPSMRAAILTLIPNGAHVQVSGVMQGDDSKNWSLVAYQGQRGYAHSELLQP